MAKPYLPSIENRPIRLRIIQELDLPMTLRWRNQDYIRKWFKHSEIVSQEQHQIWFAEYLRRANDYIFIIEETEIFLKPVGQISLYNIDWLAKCAELGRLMIGEPDALGKGLAKRATKLLVDFSFSQFHLAEIYLEVFKKNHPAIAIYRKCGFDYYAEQQDLTMMRLFNPNVDGVK